MPTVLGKQHRGTMCIGARQRMFTDARTGRKMKKRLFVADSRSNRGRGELVVLTVLLNVEL